MVEVERFRANPADGRPKIARFSGREGVIKVHVERETGALWFFCDGPRGGERAKGAIPSRKAQALREWLAGGEQGRFSTGTGFSLSINAKDDGFVVDFTVSPRGYFALIFDPEALTVFRGLLVGWSAHRTAPATNT